MRNPVFKLVKSAVLAIAFMSLTTIEGLSKPLITDSQATFASACLKGSEAPESLVEICQHGLGDIDASDRQRIEMLDMLAWAYFDLGELEKSDEAFSEILGMNPNAEPGLQGRAWMYYYRDEYALASEWFRKAVSRKPTAESLTGLAVSNRLGGQVNFDEYEQSMRLALAVDPEYTWGIRELAWSAELSTARSEDALEWFRSAIGVNSLRSLCGIRHGFCPDQIRVQVGRSLHEHVTRTLELHPEFVSRQIRAVR